MPLILDSPPSYSSSSSTAVSTTTVSTTTSTITQDDHEIRRRVHHEADVVIVGAGIVGCAAAVAFGKQGRSVILLEKSLKEPDRIVGELLQPGGVRALEGLGLGGRFELSFFFVERGGEEGLGRERKREGWRCGSVDTARALFWSRVIGLLLTCSVFRRLS
jgi:hypothetical protein